MSNLIIYVIFMFMVVVEAKIRIYITDKPLEKVGSRLYKKELLTDKFQNPKELAYDSSSRSLFFMYMDDNIQNSGRAYVNVITKEAMKIKGIERNKATAVDPDTGDVYFGSDDGLYKYDAISNTASNIGLYNMNIMKLVVRNNEMYLLDANNHMIYKVFNEGKMAVKIGNMNTIMEFEVDNQKNVHLVTMCGVYCAVNGQEVIKNTDLTIVYHFIVDGGFTYGVTYDGIYNIDCRNGTAERIADLDFFPRSIVLGDYGDIYYTTDNHIYKLRPVVSYLVYNLHKKT